jgi:hypothetical protein
MSYVFRGGFAASACAFKTKGKSINLALYEDLFLLNALLA